MGKAKKITTDLIYSISAVGLMNAVMQFVVYPIINNRIGEAAFGDMLFLLGVVNILAPSFGIAANNSRLLLPEREKIKNGDYVYVVLLFSGIATVVCGLVSAYRHISFGMSVVFVYITIITIFRNYSSVEYRLTLNYRKQFVFYVILSVGYVLGVIPLLLTDRWEMVFILGETAAVGFVVLSGSIFRKWWIRGKKCKEALASASTLSVNYLITNSMLNLDRLVLLNFVGSEAVSQYYVLSLMGKTISIISGPLNGILIGYLTKNDEKISTKGFVKAGGILLAVGSFFLVACSVATPIFIRIMYPNLYADVVSMSFAVNLSQIIYFLTGILVVIVLTVSSGKSVLRNQIIYSIFFVGSAVLMTSIKGITGYIYAAIVSNSLYFTLMFVTGLRATQKAVARREQ